MLGIAAWVLMRSPESGFKTVTAIISAYFNLPLITWEHYHEHYLPTALQGRAPGCFWATPCRYGLCETGVEEALHLTNPSVKSLTPLRFES